MVRFVNCDLGSASLERELGRAELLCVSAGDESYSSNAPWERGVELRDKQRGGGERSRGDQAKGWGKIWR